MASAKYVFLTRADEVALSMALRSKFADIQFCEWDMSYEKGDHYRKFDSIASSEEEMVRFLVVSPDWKPVFEYVPRFNESGFFWKQTNFPKLAGHLRRSVETYKNHADRPYIYAGTMQIGYEPPMTKEQLAFVSRVWRLLGSLGTYRLRVWKQGEWRSFPDKHWFAGNDALRWAREGSERYFRDGGFKYRPPEVST